MFFHHAFYISDLLFSTYFISFCCSSIAFTITGVILRNQLPYTDSPFLSLKSNLAAGSILEFPIRLCAVTYRFIANNARRRIVFFIKKYFYFLRSIFFMNDPRQLSLPINFNVYHPAAKCRTSRRTVVEELDISFCKTNLPEASCIAIAS